MLADDGLRWTESGVSARLPREELKNKISRCLELYTALLGCHKAWPLGLGRLRRFHSLPGYELLELLRDQEGAVCWFNVHFSNGELAFYRRTPNGSEPLNLLPQPNGTINLFRGVLDTCKPVWGRSTVPS